MESVRELVDHPAIRTGVATAIGYGIILAILTIVIFLLPYALFSAL